MCCYRDTKNFERFNIIIQSIIYLVIFKLRNIQYILEIHQKNSTANTVGNNSNNTTNNNNNSNSDNIILNVVNNEKFNKTETVEKTDDENIVQPNDGDNNWTLSEIEKLLILISKVFLLNFPLYIAYKHIVHSRLDEISGQEAQVFYCLKYVFVYLIKL